MTLYKFNALDKDKKANHIWSKGVVIGSRLQGKTAFLLYHLGSFYVEVLYLKEANKISDFRSFVNTGPLDPYLEKIDISIIFKQ